MKKSTSYVDNFIAEQQIVQHTLSISDNGSSSVVVLSIFALILYAREQSCEHFLPSQQQSSVEYKHV